MRRVVGYVMVALAIVFGLSALTAIPMQGLFGGLYIGLGCGAVALVLWFGGRALLRPYERKEAAKPSPGGPWVTSAAAWKAQSDAKAERGNGPLWGPPTDRES